ncbi:MAG TPA: thioesterase [Thermoanaerobaculia bacterium]|nr:thioesterase [Thermoanaerobaculia bacterium]
MPRKEIASGTAAEASWIVKDADLASALSDGHASSFPEVFATARMIALMELAAARVLVPLLEPGELSVGVSIDARHTAATPPGAKVTARAVYRGMEGKFYRFDVEAFDPGGAIGSAVHDRAIISVERLLAAARKRIG